MKSVGNLTFAPTKKNVLRDHHNPLLILLAAGFLVSGAENGEIAMEQDKITGCLLGVAIGDALGAPFESLPPQGRITDFHPYGSFSKGSWTDDTGMTLATCRGLIEHVRDERSVERCLKESFKIWAESDECRCPGHTVYHASKYGVPDLNSWANGALMRTSPVAIFAHLNGYYLLYGC